MYASRAQTWTSWAFDWSDKLPGAQLLLYQITGKDVYKNDVQAFCDYAMRIKKTPGGQTHLTQWGSNRHASNFAFICLGVRFRKECVFLMINFPLQAANAGIKTAEYTKYAEGQVGYMLGDFGRSYVVGFGVNPPKQPHHKAAACESAPAQCTWDTFSDTSRDNPHELLGALVGGPSNEWDSYVDDRTNYITNEVTLDYNAGFQGAVAGLKSLACSIQKDL